MNKRFRIYRYHPEQDEAPYMQDFELADVTPGMMLRDALVALKCQDETLTFRHSCGEGVCGSDGMNINGRNGLACITPLAELKEPIEVRPFPGLPVVRDLVVDMSAFYSQYRAVKPFLIRNDPEPEVVAAKTLELMEDGPARAKMMDGLIEVGRRIGEPGASGNAARIIAERLDGF